MIARHVIVALAMATVAGCQTLGARGPDARDAGAKEGGRADAAGWRTAATPADRSRIHDWHDVFTRAVAQARRSADGAQSTAADPMFYDPAVQLRQPLPPAGSYRCRVTKLAASQPGLLDFIAYGWFRCRIDAGDPSGPANFIKLTGSQRHIGRLWPDEATRGVFLGTLALGDEAGAQRYGADPSRDVAAVVHRIGPARWRMAIIRPAFESQLDLLELAPEGATQMETRP